MFSVRVLKGLLYSRIGLGLAYFTAIPVLASNAMDTGLFCASWNSTVYIGLPFCPSMAEDCNEKFDFAFVKWILLDGRSKKYVEQYHTVVKNYSDKTIILKNQRQLNHYMKQVK